MRSGGDQVDRCRVFFAVIWREPGKGRRYTHQSGRRPIFVQRRVKLKHQDMLVIDIEVRGMSTFPSSRRRQDAELTLRSFLAPRFVPEVIIEGRRSISKKL